MATVNLGSIKFKWKGTYSGATAYTIDDVVEYNGSSYICILASTGNLPTNATYFEQMSSAGTNGTNGTDLGTTLTTQGDLVYRDGSGLQRLGAGTAGQVLQTGGAGANPSWGTVSSDFVKLYEGTSLSGNTVSVDGYFSSTYDTYKIYLQGFDGGGGSANRISMRPNVGGSAHTTGMYSAFRSNVVDNGNSVSNAGWVGHWNSQNWTDFGYFANQSGSGNLQGSSEITIYRPLDTNQFCMMSWNSKMWDNPTSVGTFDGVIVFNTTGNGAMSGITFGMYQFGAGNVYFDKIQIYGIK